MKRKLAKRLVGAAGLPLAAGAVWAAAKALFGVMGHSREALFFLGGFAGYPAWRFASSARQGRVYVFGHELAHAAAAWTSGFRVLEFSVGRSSGHVRVSRSNAFIALAPYFVPMYALAVLIAYRACLWRWDSAPALRLGFLAALGWALSFHWFATGEILCGRRQPDLDAAGGLLFSLTVVGAANGAFLLLVLKCLFPKAVSLAMAWRRAQAVHAAIWASGLRATRAVGHVLFR